VPHPGPSGTEYERHAPEHTLLHRVVREELEPFLARARVRERPAPRFIEQELRAFLGCGILAHGFLRLHCDDCGHDRLVAFSCKRRGFCPSCGGRRMADTAAHLVERVLPHVPVRQWVLTLPYPLRHRCAYDARLTSQVLRAFLRTLFAELRRRARRHWGVRAEQCGAVTFLQRFGSALNLNLHFHTLALDGAYPYVPDPARPARFLPLPPPTRDEVERVLAGTARRLHRLLERRGDEEDDVLARDDPLLALLAAASLRTRIAEGPLRGEKWRRVGDRVAPEVPGDDPDATPRVPEHRGMTLHADVAVPAADRRRLERLCRYAARPPLSNDRLEETPDGRLLLRLKAPWRDGTTHMLMERSELLERLVPLIPPPRAHQVRYHGILAPCASMRRRVVPASEIQDDTPSNDTPVASGSSATDRSRSGSAEALPSRSGNGAGATQAQGATPAWGLAARPEGREPDEGSPSISTASRGASPRRYRWAELLQRVFAIDALRCPRCGSTLRLVAAIEDPAIARRILECMELPARAPPSAAPGSGLHAVSEPDQAWSSFDQTPPDADGWE